MTTSFTLSATDYAVFGIYLAASLSLGLMAGGKQKDLKTYLLAGHQMHWSLIAISVLAALFSGISFLGAPAETYHHNLVYLWTLVAYLVATPITTLIFLPFFFKLNFYTAYEYLEHRFSVGLRQISSAVFIFRVSLWLALALFAPSLVISEMVGLPLWISIVVTSSCTLLYTVIGGMRAVIYTDVMQFAVLFIGIAAIVFIALGKIPGGLEGAWQIAEAGGRTHLMDLSISPSARMTVWGAFIGGIFVSLVGLVTDQVSVQRYLTAASLRECQRALWFKLMLTLPFVSVFYLTGLVLYAFYQSNPEMLATLTSPDRLLPNFVIRQVAAPFPGLLVAAILAATMSTVSAGINSLTTATLMDFIYRGDNETGSRMEENRRVRTARLWTVFYSGLTTLLALGIERLGTLIEASKKISGFLGGPLLGIFFLGVFSRRANARGTLIGAIAGFAAVFGAGAFTSISFMWYAMVGCLVTWGVGELASFLFPKPTAEQLRFSFSGQKTLSRPEEPCFTSTERHQTAKQPIEDE